MLKERQTVIQPSQDKEGQIINIAKANRLAIQCDGAAGETTAFIHSGVDDLWVVRRRLAGDVDTWVVDNSTQETIRNVIVQCQPDVHLIEERESLFGEIES